MSVARGGLPPGRTPVGLRIDVDTFRGTRLGVPELCRILRQRGITASFFFSVGPDNMGRHVWRLLRPTFLLKMLRSRAAGLYGWDILLRGTLWPGPKIGRRLGSVLRACADDGHEIGLHAWDHHRWQAKIDGWSVDDVRREIVKGVNSLKALGLVPQCAASPGWRTTDAVLKARAVENNVFNSDCRGEGVFSPVVAGDVLQPPQVPVNLPTYDEVVGRDGVTEANYNDFILEQLTPQGYNVLTVHAEVEGIRASSMFEEFLDRSREAGFDMVPLSALIPSDIENLPTAAVVRRQFPGREGWLAFRGESS